MFRETDDRMSRVLGILMPRLLGVYTDERVGSEIRRKCLELVYHGLDSLSWADGVDPVLMRKGLATWQDWLPLLLQILTAPSSPDDLRSALQVLTVFYRDFPTFSKDYTQVIVRPIWFLLYSLLPLYYRNVLYGQDAVLCRPEEDDDEVAGVHGVAVLMLELLSALSLRLVVRQALAQELTPILRTLANYTLLSTEQESLWDSDPTQYLVDEDSDVGIRSARSCALKLISELLDVFREDAIKSVATVVEMMCADSLACGLRNTAEIVQRTVTNQEEIVEFVGQINAAVDTVVKGAAMAHAWKSREAAVIILGKMANDVLAYNIQAAKRGDDPIALDRIFEAVIYPDLIGQKTNRGSDILKGRALWCLARLNELLNVESPIYTGILDLCVNSASPGHSLPVRLSACLAISKFGKHSTPPLIDRLVLVLTYLFELAPLAVEDTLHLVLETIRDLSNLSVESTSQIAAKYASAVLRLFQLHYGDTVIGGDIIALLRLWTDIPAAAQSLSAVLLTYITSLLRSETETPHPDSPLPSALDLLQMLLMKLKSGTKEANLVLDLFPGLLRILMSSADLQVLMHGTNCLRAFVSHFHESILERGYGDRVLEVMSRLLSCNLNETAAPHLGYCLAQVFDRISPKIDEDLVIGCVTKLYKSKMPSIVQGLVLVCARLIHLNPNALISFLLNISVERRVGLKVLLDKWLIHQPLIRGKYTKNATVSALARLFSLKDKRLETLLVIGFNPSHSNLSSEVPAPLKILSTLIRCLDNEAAPRKAKSAQAMGLNEEFNTVVDAGGLGVGGHIDYEEGERMDTVEDDEVLSQGSEGPADDAMAGLKKQLLNEVEEEFESTFQFQEKKEKGLGDYETGSECLMSDMLDFDYDDGDELGEDFYEDDMYTLGDWYGSINLQNFLLEFFGRLIENDRDYLKSCLKHMLGEDAALFKKHFTLV